MLLPFFSSPRHDGSVLRLLAHGILPAGRDRETEAFTVLADSLHQRVRGQYHRFFRVVKAAAFCKLCRSSSNFPFVIAVLLQTSTKHRLGQLNEKMDRLDRQVRD